MYVVLMLQYANMLCFVNKINVFSFTITMLYCWFNFLWYC